MFAISLGPNAAFIEAIGPCVNLRSYLVIHASQPGELPTPMDVGIVAILIKVLNKHRSLYLFDDGFA